MKKLMRLLAILGLSLGLIACSQNEESDTASQDQVAQETSEEENTQEVEEESKEVEEKDEEAEEESQKTDFDVVDIEGRTIHFDQVPETKIIMGHGALKYYVYVAGIDGIIGIEAAEVNDQTLNGQSIHYAYPDLREVEIVGQGGPQFQPDEELLAHMEPDVVFVAYNNTKEELDQLQDKIQVPVVGISTGQHGNIFDDDIKESLTIIGQVTDNEDRADELNQYIADSQKDLEARAGNIEDSPEVYLGGMSFRGPQGILSTKTQYPLFDVVNIKNIMDSQTDEKNVMIDQEKLIELDPEMIVIDLSGKAQIDEDMANNPSFYENLTAFQEGEVYPIMPYFTYGLNLDTAILDTYYLGSVVFPENFEDVDLREKATEVYETFVGEDVYDQLKEYYDQAFETRNLENIQD